MNKSFLWLFLYQVIKGAFLSDEELFKLKQSKNENKVIILSPEARVSFESAEPLIGRFAVDLTTYKDHEEGILTLKTYENMEIKSFYSRYITGLEEKDLINNFPLDESDFPYVQTDINKQNYFMFFRRNDTNSNPWLLISIEFEIGNKAEIVLSLQERKFDVYSSVQSNNFVLPDFIPKLVKYNVEKEFDFGDSYIFHCNCNNYMTFIPGNILNNPSNYKINPDRNFYQLYGYTLPLDAALNEQLTVSIVLFGEGTQITVSVKNTFSKMIYLNDEKPKDRIFHFEVVNAFDPFYFLGTYDYPATSLIYFERLYGNFDLYYKDTIYGDSIDNVLANTYDEKANNYAISTTNTELFTGFCGSPCGFNIHFISEFEGEIELKPGNFRVLYVESEKEVKVTIKETGKSILEMRNIENKTELIMFDGDLTVETPMKEIFLYPFEVVEGQPKVYRFKSYDKCIFSIKMKSKNNYIQYKPLQTIVTYFAVIEIEEETKTISEYNLFFKNLNEDQKVDLYFYLGYGPLNFLHDPQFSKIENYKENTFSLLNPYLQQYPYTNLTNSKYYLLMRIESSVLPNFQFSIETNSFLQLDPLKEDEAILIPKANQYLLNDGPLDQQLIIMATKCSTEDVIVKMKYYHVTFKAFFIKKQFSITLFSNPFNKTSVYFNNKNSSENFPGLMVYYMYNSINDIDNVEFNTDFSLSYALVSSEKDNKTKETEELVSLTWKSPMMYRADYNVTYWIYKYDTKQGDEKYDLCRADQFKDVTEYNTTLMDIKYNLPVDRKKDNYIFIVAQPTEDVKPKFFYKTIFVPKLGSIIEQTTLLWLYITIGVLGAISIGLAIGYIFILKKNKNTVDLTKMPDNSPLVEE